MLDPKLISKISSISSVLEVSGYPKPGNVHRMNDFPDMVFEDFLISGVVTGETIENATKHIKKHGVENSQVGKYILNAINETDKWIKNNTNLGIMMLEVPIAQATIISENFNQIQENIGLILKNSTVEDAINLYDAINIADAGGMGDQEEYDVQSENAKNELRENNQTMFDVLEISSKWDQLAYELTNKMPTLFNTGFKTFQTIKKESSINNATITTFLTLLSQVPDTLISRKYGIECAKNISNKAKNILENKNNENFKKQLIEFDKYLFENKFNPGTTADLTASSIMLSFLNEAEQK